MQQQSAYSQTTSYLKYLTSIERVATIVMRTPFALYGNGTYWRMYAKDGDESYLRHHTVSISKFSAHMELLLGRIWVSGQPFPSLLIIVVPLPGPA